MAARDLKLTRLWAIISPYLTKFIKYNKLNTAFLHEIVIIFSPFYLSETSLVIKSFNLQTELENLTLNAMIIHDFLDHLIK